MGVDLPDHLSGPAIGPVWPAIGRQLVLAGQGGVEPACLIIVFGHE